MSQNDTSSLINNNIFDEDINDIFTNYLIEALLQVQTQDNETRYI